MLLFKNNTTGVRMKENIVFECTTLKELDESEFKTSLLGVWVFVNRIRDDPLSQELIEPEDFYIEIYEIDDKFNDHKIKLTVHGITIAANFSKSNNNQSLHELLIYFFIREAIKTIKHLRGTLADWWREETGEELF
jgi:hypothetical protein